MAGCATCGKSKQRMISGAEAAAKQAAARSLPGYTPESAVLLGGETEDAPIRVRVVKSVGRLESKVAAWVKGSGVQPLIDDGTLVVLGSTPQKRRVWKVGDMNFLDEAQAQAASGALGIPAVEIA